MKKLFTAAVVAMLTCSAVFAQGQKVIIGKNGSKTLEPGFQVEKYQVLGSKDLVGVDVNGGVARVTGLKEGTCSVKVIGAGNMEEIYEVVVGDDLMQVQRNLQTELEHQLDVKQTMLSHRNISGYHQREKMVDKLEEILAREKAKLPSGAMSMSFNVVPEERSGAEDKILLQVKDVSKKFDDEPCIFEHITFELKANQKIFLAGPNGCGKSTLLTMLMGRQGGFDGTVFIASSASVGYMEQFVPFEDESISCFDELIARSDLSNTEARSMLARFGFRGEDAFKAINVLSGGESLQVCHGLSSIYQNV